VLDGVTIEGGNPDVIPIWKYYGGGIFIVDVDGMSIRNVVLRHNFAHFGGGLYVSASNITLVNSAFTENVGLCGGGAAFDFGSQAPISNTTFYANAAAAEGAALCLSDSSVSLAFVTISANQAADGAAGIALEIPRDLTLANSIVWGNTGSGEVFDGAITVSNSLVQGGWPGTGNFDSDPLLAPFGINDGLVPAIPLLPGSPAIDAAASGCLALDARDLPRSSPACDLGAFESQGFALSIAAGDGQQVVVGAPFAQSLSARVKGLNPIEPVEGGLVTFTAPASGPGAVLAGSPATIHNELASITAVANDHNGGPYAIVAALPTGESVAFDLTNLRFMFSVVLPYVIWYPRR